MAENELHEILHGNKALHLQASSNPPEGPSPYVQHTGSPPGYTAPQASSNPPEGPSPYVQHTGSPPGYTAAPQYPYYPPQPQAPQQSYFGPQPQAGQNYVPGYQPLVNQPQPSSSNSTTVNNNVVVQQTSMAGVIRPYNYLVHSILTTCFCCPLLGIIAIIYGCLVDSAYDDGDYPRARSFSVISRRLNVAALVFGVFGYVCIFLVPVYFLNNS